MKQYYNRLSIFYTIHSLKIIIMGIMYNYETFPSLINWIYYIDIGNYFKLTNFALISAPSGSPTDVHAHPIGSKQIEVTWKVIFLTCETSM